MEKLHVMIYDKKRGKFIIFNAHHPVAWTVHYLRRLPNGLRNLPWKKDYEDSKLAMYSYAEPSL